MKKVFLFIAVVIMAALISCSGGDKKNGSSSDSTKTKDSIAKSSVGGKYDLKSGIITMTSETMGMKQTMIKYFDDYGNKECMEITGEMKMGMGSPVKMNHTNITVDGFLYNLDNNKKTGTKMAVKGKGGHKDIEFKNLTEDQMKELNMTKGGTETILGKTCNKFTLNDTKRKMKATYYVWDGILLKSEVSMAGITAVNAAIKIEENATVPDGKFTIPTDYKITESTGLPKKKK